VKFAVSNIALPSYSHFDELVQLGTMGLQGIEVAPSRVWKKTWKGLSAKMVTQYRADVERAGLRIIGLHSLFYDHPNLGLFCSEEYMPETLDFMVHLSSVCRDLGGKQLIYGGGRNRGNISKYEAFQRTIDFCGTLCNRIQTHGTIYCFEPLSPRKSDFINTVEESVTIVETLNNRAFQVQIDAEALAENNEISEKTFLIAQPYLIHVHANEPNFGILGSSGLVDHKAIGGYLRGINYSGFVSIEQKMFNQTDPVSGIAKSVSFLKKNY
jgi:sugar phosphate isomerase/epimerase